ncbi:MerR family transcriptional regulator [Enterococcus casseliflavus]|uniref:MerR family transcriptional regulator n=1 Tax=Enterococcus casseliflavus TaxID=37734 RepID=UPI0018A9CFA5|nr:MerR family transcriptional regulator [Enterococcus casseliflavus]
MKLLTTSELASLFSISKHTIRHYIDIELLTPKERNENGYFFFDEENIYKLYQILVLKNIGYSLRSIKTILTQSNMAPFFIEAEQTIQKKIDELLAIKNTVHAVIEAQNSYKLNEISFFERSDRYFHSFPESVVENGEVDLIKANNMNLSSLDQIFYVIMKMKISLVLKVKRKKGHLLLLKGLMQV